VEKYHSLLQKYNYKDRKEREINKLTTENTQTNNICAPVFNQRLAGWLMQKGFVLMDMRPNEKYESRNVFYFRNSIQLEQAIQEYLNRA
jgi:hypothetical protein